MKIYIIQKTGKHKIYENIYFNFYCLMRIPNISPYAYKESFKMNKFPSSNSLI